MAINRLQETVCFQSSPAGCSELLVAGHRHQKGPQPMIRREPTYYLFHYVEKGEGTVTLSDGREQRVSAGDWFFAFPGQAITYSQNPERRWMYYWVGFQGDRVDELLLRAGISPETGVRRGDVDMLAVALIQKMIHLLDGQSLTSGVEANIALSELICHLIRTTPDKARLIANRSSRITDESVEQACRFIAEYFPEGIGANDVCDVVGFERSYFSKTFSQSTGTTIRDYLARVRLIRAKELLRQQELSVSEIATAVGYSEARTFSHFFKKQTGLSPRIWRSRS